LSSFLVVKSGQIKTQRKLYIELSKLICSASV
jgi:hypothetical protein